MLFMSIEDGNNTSRAPDFITFKCPNCGGALSLPAGGRAECPYCGGKFFPTALWERSDAWTRYFLRMEYNPDNRAHAAGAYVYFVELLESNPEDGVAWFEKGVAALAKSQEPYFNSQEAITCFNKAIQYAPAEDRDGFKTCISRWAIYFAKAIYERYDWGEWLSAAVVEELYALVIYADRLERFNVAAMKYWVAWMDKQAYIDYGEAINIYTARIRKAEPDYRKPEEVRAARNLGALLILAVLSLLLAAAGLVFLVGNLLFYFISNS
jgi:tetratricopeptide (TPR) repeat protein